MQFVLCSTTGMNEKVGLLSYRMDRDMFEKPYSNETAQLIDNEVRAEVEEISWGTLNPHRFNI